MAIIQVRLDDKMKSTADALFSNLGLDTSTAVRMFIAAAIRANGIPFPIMGNFPNADIPEPLDMPINPNLAH